MLPNTSILQTSEIRPPVITSFKMVKTIRTYQVTGAGKGAMSRRSITVVSTRKFSTNLKAIKQEGN
jgi:hypothetical protein